MVSIYKHDTFSKDELKSLFSSVGWADDLSDDALYSAISKSSHYVTARRDGVLIGFARSMDDGIWSANIDCVVVHRLYQGEGVGSAMLEELLSVLVGIRYISVSPDHAVLVPFYEKHGFKLVHDGRLLQREQPRFSF